ncbi:MAG: divalent-cation tolerance protein CutA [Azospirillaceae bacterium]
MSALFVYVTTGSMAEARAVGRALIEARLAACVNVIPGMRSMYHWQGAVEEDEEIVVIAKTRAELLDRVTETIKAVHSYDCPCVVALPIEGGKPAFLDWIEAETSGASG